MEIVSKSALTSIQPLVDLLAIGSATGRSSSLLINDSRGSDSATMIFPPRSSYVEPGSYPHVLNRENQSQKQFHGQRQQHAHGEKLKCHVLQQAGARQEFLFELVFRKQAQRTQSDLLEVHRHQPMKEQRTY